MVKEVLAYLETHWDREWYKTFEEYRFRLCDVLNDILKKIESGEINSFYLDGQTIALDDYLEIYPEKKEYIIDLIKNKKLFAGPFYDLADEFLVCGESLIRNLLIGRKEALNYGMDEKDFVGYLPDAFGHSSFMPMIFNKFNINRAVVWRGVSDVNQEFLWISPDNSQIRTTYLAAGYYQDFFAQKSYKNNVNKLLGKLNAYTQNNTPILLPIGADHLACEDNIKAKIKNFNRNNSAFRIKLSSLREYLKKTNNASDLKKIKGELLNNSNSCLLYGVHSSRVYLKQINTLLEWKISKIVEPLYALMNELPARKENIDYIWKLLIQNHAHDSICGCCVDETHRENMVRFEKVCEVANTIIDNAKCILSKKIEKNKIGIFNLSNYTYSGVVSYFSDKKLPLICVGKNKAFPVSISQDMHRIPIQENYNYRYEYLINIDKIKGFEFEIISPESTTKKRLKATLNSIENENILISVNSDGTLNIKNKRTGKILNNIFKITDEADVGDSYNFSCIPDDVPLNAKFKNSKIVENNDLRKILRLTYEMNIPTHARNDKARSKKLFKHAFFADLILTAGAKRVDFKINYSNLSKDHILKLNFNLPKSITKVVSDDTFGTIEREFEKDYNYKKKLPIPEFTELDVNSRPMRRFVMTQGLCIITKGLHEYEVFENNLNISLLRSFGIISKRRLATRAFAAGPPLPAPEGQCIGKQIAEFSILLTSDTNEAFKEADFFYEPFFVVDGDSSKSEITNKFFIDIPENFYIYNIKQAENGNGIIAKIFNNSDKKSFLKLPLCKYISEVNFIEEKLNDKNLSGKSAEFSKFELKTFRINFS